MIVCCGYNNKYNCANTTHLIVNQDICKKCSEKPCIHICPADVYNLNDETKEIIVKYENCYIAGYFEDEFNNYIKKLYSNDSRYNDIILFADQKINTGIYKFTIDDLPPLNTFEQKLQEETKIIRNFSIDNKNNCDF